MTVARGPLRSRVLGSVRVSLALLLVFPVAVTAAQDDACSGEPGAAGSKLGL